MTFSRIRGQEAVISLLKKIVACRRVASAYLFVGPPGTGRKTTALAFAAALNCREGEACGCGACPSCLRIQKENHPDVRIWRILEGKKMVTIDLVRQIEASLMFRPYYGGYKVAILDEADTMNWEAANAFLHTLEEPPPMTVLILVATNYQLLPETVVSRCQWIYFQPLTDEIVKEMLMSLKGAGQAQAEIAATLAEGSLVAATEYLEDAWQKSWRDGLMMVENVASGDERAVFVQAGNVSMTRNDVARMVSILEKIFRLSLKGSLGLIGGVPKEESLERCRSIVSDGLDEEGFLKALEKFQEAKMMLKGNVNARLVLEGLLIDIDSIFRKRKVRVSR